MKLATSKKQKESKIKARSKKADDKQKTILEMLKSHGAKIYDDLDNGQFPKFSIPSRSVSNIVYDKKLRQYILGNNAALRSSRNSAQLRSFTQLMWLAFFANRLTNERKSSTLRDVYYSSQAFAVEFEDQSESDNIIVDLEAVTSRAREDFHIFPEERSSIFGDLNIEYTIPGYEGKTMNCKEVYFKYGVYRAAVSENPDSKTVTTIAYYDGVVRSKTKMRVLGEQQARSRYTL